MVWWLGFESVLLRPNATCRNAPWLCKCRASLHLGSHCHHKVAFFSFEPNLLQANGRGKISRYSVEPKTPIEPSFQLSLGNTGPKSVHTIIAKLCPVSLRLRTISRPYFHAFQSSLGGQSVPGSTASGGAGSGREGSAVRGAL